jgi:hypothetical protein
LFKERSIMTKKHLMIVTLVTVLVLTQTIVALADPSGPESQGPITEPVGGHTEPARLLTLVWPWLALAAAIATGTIAAVTLKRRTA